MWGGDAPREGAFLFLLLFESRKDESLDALGNLEGEDGRDGIADDLISPRSAEALLGNDERIVGRESLNKGAFARRQSTLGQTGGEFVGVFSAMCGREAAELDIPMMFGADGGTYAVFAYFRLSLAFGEILGFGEDVLSWVDALARLAKRVEDVVGRDGREEGTIGDGESVCRGGVGVERGVG